MTNAAPRPAAPAAEHAAAARALLARERFGTLATLAREPAGHPFASLTGYAPGVD